MKQRHWFCSNCGREGAVRLHLAEEDPCWVCGAPIEWIEFEGLFDISTPSDVLTRLYLSNTPLGDPNTVRVEETYQYAGFQIL